MIAHPPFRDDAIAAYAPVEVLQNPAKAAALRIFVRYWGLSQAWQQAHPDELAQGYYVQHQGLKLADAKLILKAAGRIVVPTDWREPVAYQQATIDLLAPEMGHLKFDASSLFDFRFENIAADAAAKGTAGGAATARDASVSASGQAARS